MLKWLFTTSKKEERWAERFSEWFGSVAGLKQQVVPIFIWIAIALIDPNFDHQLILLMAILTVYSAVTQPVLMMGSNRPLKMLQQLLKNNIDTLEAIKGMVEQLEKLEKQNAAKIEQMADDLEEIQEGIQHVSD
jgi:uncharacterized membrane protein